MPDNAQATLAAGVAREVRKMENGWTGRPGCSILLAVAICCAWGPAAGTYAAARPPYASEYELADSLMVDRLTVQPLEVPEALVATFSVRVTLADAPYTLDLRRSSVRDPSFRVHATRPDGTLQLVEAPPPCTYRGEAVGAVGGIVAASLRGGRLTATIVLEDGAVWHAQPLTGILPETPLALHAVYRDRDVVAGDGTCGVRSRRRPEADATNGPRPARAQGLTTALIAFDGDQEYYNLNGMSVAASVSDIEALLNGVNVIYESYVGITHFLTEVIIRTVNPPEYTSSDPDTLLDGVIALWNANHGDVTRDLVHMMTGKNLDGSTVGIAETGVICSLPQFSYGLSQASFGGNFATRVGVTAHELGHNWNALHCDQGRPEWLVDCWIMCSNIGGCSNNVAAFGPYAVGAITGWRDAHTCTPAPAVPEQIGVFRNGSWFLDLNGNHGWDGAGGGDEVFGFGLPGGDQPIVGDWNGYGADEVGVFRNGWWYLDLNGNHGWNGVGGGDARIQFGLPGDQAVAGDWNADGTDQVGVFRNGWWYLDLNGNDAWNGVAGGDGIFQFGLPGDQAVAGDWNGNGTDQIGVFRNGWWYLDLNGNNAWNGVAGGDGILPFGLPGSDRPVAGHLSP